ncbi:MAG: hypothetical protein ABI612_18320 [Betaproteobacteria bacterium]
MEMSFLKYVLIGPGGLLLLVEFFLPPFRALYPSGVSVAMGRSPFYLPPNALGASAVAINWGRLSVECLAMVLCLAAAYWFLVALERLGAREVH